jgi:aminoglycoside phosphotransferase (APT) family kinase protein
MMVEALQAWLSRQLDRPVLVSAMHRIATGHSRAMWYVELDDGQRLVVRVEQGGVFGTSSASEFELMRAAGRLGCPVANVRWLEASGDVLGQPFFVMDFIESEVANREDRSLDDAVAIDLIRRLDDLHRARWETEISAPCDPATATRQQIDRWAAVYHSASTSAIPLLDEAAAWLLRHAPTLEQASIVHGDPGPGNFLHNGAAVVAFTDWEFAHVGDPTEDWVYLIAMRGARTMPPDRWRTMIAETVAVEVTDWHMRYWGAFNFFKGACANLTCLEVFAGPNPAPNMAIIGSALQQTFMHNMAALVAG